jgi:hypothetical protein
MPLSTPEPIKDWSLTSLRERLIKIGAKVVICGHPIIAVEFVLAVWFFERQRIHNANTRESKESSMPA